MWMEHRRPLRDAPLSTVVLSGNEWQGYKITSSQSLKLYHFDRRYIFFIFLENIYQRVVKGLMQNNDDYLFVSLI